MIAASRASVLPSPRYPGRGMGERVARQVQQQLAGRREQRDKQRGAAAGHVRRPRHLAERSHVGNQRLQLRLVVSDPPRQQPPPPGHRSPRRGDAPWQHPPLPNLAHRSPRWLLTSSFPGREPDHAGVTLLSDRTALPNQQPGRLRGTGRPSKFSHVNGSALTATPGSPGPTGPYT